MCTAYILLLISYSSLLPAHYFHYLVGVHLASVNLVGVLPYLASYITLTSPEKSFMNDSIFPSSPSSPSSTPATACSCGCADGCDGGK